MNEVEKKGTRKTKAKAVPTEEMSEDEIKERTQELTNALKPEPVEKRIEKLTKEIDAARKQMEVGFIILLIVNVIIFFALLYFTK